MVTKANSFVSSRGSLFVAMAATAAVLGLGSVTQGATMTYTPPSTSTDLWNAGTDWSATPVSNAATTLTFVGSNGTILANGLTNTNTDNFSAGFQANIINLQGTGPASGAATINIAAPSGSYLNMVNSGTADPIINLNANAGTAGLTYNVTAPITYASSGTYKRLALWNNGTAAFNFSGGITTTGTTSFLDNSQSTVTLSGFATNTFTGGLSTGPALHGILNINANVVANGNNGVGFLNLQSGTFTQGNNATVNVGTVGSLTSYAYNADIGQGKAGNQGTYTLNSGTLNINVSHAGLGLLVGSTAGDSGILNVNGGTLNNYAENSASPTTDALTTLYVAMAGTGTVNQTGGTVNTSTVELGGNGSTASTYNLSGGTLATSMIDTAGSNSTSPSVFNFNGGTLQANGPAPATLYGRFTTGLTAANVQSGGAIIDSNGQTVWFAQSLVHDSSLGSTLDGGLTKKGAGTLELTDTNTYTGATTVAGGTLAVGVLVQPASGIGSLANSNITIDSGATLSGMTPNSSTVGVLNFNISGNTSNLITDNGTFDITDLALVFNLSGKQTMSQYLLANYTNGSLVGTKFYSTTLANGWSIDYGTLHPGEIVLVNANPVPEPASLGLLAVGGLGLLLLGKRRHA